MYKAEGRNAEFRTRRISGSLVFGRIFNPILTNMKMNCLDRIWKVVVDFIHSKIFSPNSSHAWKVDLYNVYKTRLIWIQKRVFSRFSLAEACQPRAISPTFKLCVLCYVSGLASFILTNISATCPIASIYIQRYARVFVLGYDTLWVGSFEVTWILDPDPDHPKGTHSIHSHNIITSRQITVLRLQ